MKVLNTLSIQVFTKFCINLQETTMSRYCSIATDTGLEGGERGCTETGTRLPEWRTRMQWLLVFDNADDIDLLFPRSDDPHKARGLSEYLPRSRQRAIVFTTRDRKMAVKLTGQNVLEVFTDGREYSLTTIKELLSGSATYVGQKKTN